MSLWYCPTVPMANHWAITVQVSITNYMHLQHAFPKRSTPYLHGSEVASLETSQLRANFGKRENVPKARCFCPSPYQRKTTGVGGQVRLRMFGMPGRVGFEVANTWDLLCCCFSGQRTEVRF